MGQDVASLNNLLRTLNDPNITGAAVPEGEDISVQSALAVPGPVVTQHEAPPAPAVSRNLSRIFYTGRLCAGKDYVAHASNAAILGFADPIYSLVHFLTGVEVGPEKGKDIPGIRELLQIFGQWGRGEVNLKYPWTPARALFTYFVRQVGPLIPDKSVEWANFGSDRDLWLKSLSRRLEKVGAAERIALTNVRFKNEFEFFRARGFEHYHVMCGSNTWAQRLQKRGLTPQSPAVNDLSEQLSAYMDRMTIDAISKQKSGPKLHVIWNDMTPPPSPRLLTVSEFLSSPNLPALDAAALAGASLE